MDTVNTQVCTRSGTYPSIVNDDQIWYPGTQECVYTRYRLSRELVCAGRCCLPCYVRGGIFLVPVYVLCGTRSGTCPSITNNGHAWCPGTLVFIPRYGLKLRTRLGWSVLLPGLLAGRWLVVFSFSFFLEFSSPYQLANTHGVSNQPRHEGEVCIPLKNRGFLRVIARPSWVGPGGFPIYRWSSRIGSGSSSRYVTGRVGSGQSIFKYDKSGRVNLTRSDSREVTRPVKIP